LARRRKRLKLVVCPVRKPLIEQASTIASMIFSELDGRKALAEWNRLFHSETPQKFRKIIVRPIGEANRVQELNAVLSMNRALSKTSDIREIDPLVRNSSPGSFIREAGYRPSRVAARGITIDSVVPIEGRAASLPPNPVREYWLSFFDRERRRSSQ
jgi:hypothetical protein